MPTLDDTYKFAVNKILRDEHHVFRMKRARMDGGFLWALVSDPLLPPDEDAPDTKVGLMYSLRYDIAPVPQKLADELILCVAKSRARRQCLHQVVR